MLPVAAWSRTFSFNTLELEVTSESERTCRITGLNSSPSTTLGMLTIPYSVTDNSGVTYTITEVGESAFEGRNINTMTIDRGSAQLFFGHNALKSASLTELRVSRDFSSAVNDEPFFGLTSLERLTIGEGMTRIPAFAFAKTSIADITLSATVESVGFGAFQCCNSLRMVNFASVGSMKTIGGEAFWSCGALSSVNNMQAPLTTIGEAAFANTAIRSIIIPSTVTSIGRNVFAGCESLSNVSMMPGNSVYAYSNGLLMNSDRTVVLQLLTNVTSVDVPEGVSTIGNSAFWQSQVRTVTLPSTLTAIEDNAFYSCRKLSVIELPEGLKTVGEDAFAYCTSLTAIELPEGLTALSRGSFKCSGLTSIAFPMTLRAIPEKAFSRTMLTSVEIPDHINEIGASAFEACPALAKATFGTRWNTVTAIPASAFKECAKLAEVRFPDFLTEIGESAFSKCYALNTVSLPATTTSIAALAFEGITEITNVEVSAGLPPELVMNSFNTGVYRNAKLVVPVGYKDIYAKAKGWNLFSTIEESENLSGINGVTPDGSDGPITVYTLYGVKVYEGPRADMPKLPSGIYIAGGQKIRF